MLGYLAGHMTRQSQCLIFAEILVEMEKIDRKHVTKSYVMLLDDKGVHCNDNNSAISLGTQFSSVHRFKTANIYFCDFVFIYNVEFVSLSCFCANKVLK